MVSSNITTSSCLSFSFMQPIELDRMNYLVCKTHVLASIKGNDLEGFINDDKPCPTQFLSELIGESSKSEVITRRPTENPKYIVWKKTDKLLQT